MISFKIQLALLLFLIQVKSFDYCREYETYLACIDSNEDKCMWDNNRNLCQKTNDYLQGCSLSLNRKACIRQIGNALGQLAKCRFTNVCEVIPDFKTEKCLNNLSKSGCLSIQNLNQICFWKDDMCQVLYQNQWSQVQKDFDSIQYSASACFLIENYLIIHSTLLWDIISYAPDLFVEADNIYKKEIGLTVEDSVIYDNPNTVFMQNNFQFSNGTYSWYKFRESREIKLSNLKRSYRYRDGCIALEIKNDDDFLKIFSLTDEVIGINHIYCKYLNKSPSTTKSYIFSDSVCKEFNKSDLNNEAKINEKGVSCKSMDFYQCIYQYSNKNICRLKGLEYEYPCLNQEKDYVADCLNSYCTVRQCSQITDYYMDTNTNKCSKICSSYQLKTKEQCEAIKGCKFSGESNIFFVRTCLPEKGCDQPGIQNFYCKTIKDICGWDKQLQRCYTIQEEDLKLIKCNQAVSAQSCMMVKLSDQICFWDIIQLQCKNVLDYPILIAHKALVYYERIGLYAFIRIVSNQNFCKYQQGVQSEYLPSSGKCSFDQRDFVNDLKQINKYSCVMVQPGYLKWDPLQLICLSFTESEVSQFNCLDQIYVNEKVCQKSKISQPNYICIYDSDTNSCKEIPMSQFEEYGCSGYGFTKELCLNKKKFGAYCQFQAGICNTITESYINSVQCSSLSNVNQQVCQLYSSFSLVCLYDESINSCYTPSVYTKITYSKDLNLYGCQLVKDSLTYFDQDQKSCIQFSHLDTDLLSNLECKSNYVNQETCQSIRKNNQYCFWDTVLNQCKDYSGYFINCSEYATYSSRICTALVADLTRQLLKDNYCTYIDNTCQSKTDTLLDCGESEYMNIHRCIGLTGQNQAGEYIQMCAFINNKCTTLIDNSMNTYILLNTISCQQANLKACTKVETNGNYCKLFDYVSNNNTIIDKKCSQINDKTQSCTTINSNTSGSTINPNHCSRANDVCLYDSKDGCIQPTNTNLECNTPGLSQCAFYDNKCQYLSFNQTVSDCGQLNSFSCSYFPFLKCYWNGELCVASTNLTTQYGSDYTCSLDTSNSFLISTGISCQVQQLSNYSQYSCDSKLNQYACGSIPNQYCQFIQNECQFYKPTLCEDSQQTCSQNNSQNLKCVLKNGRCFNQPNANYNCEFFDKTNYQFCLQYPNCVYKDEKCQQIKKLSGNQSYCYNVNQLACLIQNYKDACVWEQDKCQSFYGESCPSLNGFYSQQSCVQFQNCHFGYTKSGIGFCYLGQSFNSITCNQLNKDLCIEDLSHLNPSLLCYWDQSCKNIKDNQINKCVDLLNFQSTYAACSQFNQEECMYSFVDKKCKLIKEYNSTICQGTTVKQCSQIENICYFDGQICKSNGIQEQLNKYGCISQQGTWKFDNFKCNQIVNEIQKTCNHLSKDACLSDLTKELNCQWKNNHCYRVQETENKQITSCLNLNQRACQNVLLSNIQCVWNETTKNCDKLNITNTNCTLDSLVKTSSLSACSGSTNKSCVKHYDQTKCAEINVKVSNCTLYGLSRQACIYNTDVPCRWIQINEGGYCDNANLYTAICQNEINEQACKNIITPGQACKWDKQAYVCLSQEISTCESASNLNSYYACNLVEIEPCYFDLITKSCIKIQFEPSNCSIYYNQLACMMSKNNCLWYSNKCGNSLYFNCEQYLTKSRCLESDSISCEWKNNQCVDFTDLYDSVYCIDLPSNINAYACRQNSIDPCLYDSKSMSCIPDQNVSGQNFYSKTITQLISLQKANYRSPILSGKCEQLITNDHCTKSRIPSVSCVWKDSSCQEVMDFKDVICDDQLNFQGCLNVQKENQFCFWKNQKCLNWNTDISQMENVNKNVCIHHSINSVYEANSCIKKDIKSILCSSDGISKLTCLSIQNKQCQWIDSCIEFVLQQQYKCSDFHDVSSYVCQMIQNLACVYDIQTKSCIDFKEDSVGLGVSKQACMLNKQIPTYWNGNTCQQLNYSIECDTALIVNEYACRSIVHNKSCIYDAITNQCTSQFNIWSLKCNTLGLNLVGCVQIKQEPCIFRDNQCQLFTEVSNICTFINQVNSKACASIRDQKCSYDSINFKCQTLQMQQGFCQIEGISKSNCQTNELCKWNNDNLDCKCKSIQEIEVCQQSSVAKCRSQTKCYFDLDRQSCIKKQCYHLNENECDQIVDNKVCYRSLKNGCQPATKCEDIIDPKNACSTIYINQQYCIQAGNVCITETNYKLSCPYSDCLNSNCIIYYGTCKMKTCQDLNTEDCLKRDICYLDKEKNCQELLRCSQITQDLYGDQVLNICNRSSVSGFKCNWQKHALLDDNEMCTNKVCEYQLKRDKEINKEIVFILGFMVHLQHFVKEMKLIIIHVCCLMTNFVSNVNKLRSSVFVINKKIFAVFRMENVNLFYVPHFKLKIYVVKHQIDVIGALNQTQIIQNKKFVSKNVKRSLMQMNVMVEQMNVILIIQMDYVLKGLKKFQI